MKFDTILCNPPYNGADTNKPIYHNFMSNFKGKCEQSAWLFPNTWIGNPAWAIGNSVRVSLDAFGLHEVIMCPKSTFEPQAQVVTCVCICGDGPQDEFLFEDRDSRNNTSIGRKRLLKERIPFVFTQEEMTFVDRLKSKERIHPFDCKDGTWKIGPYNVNPARKEHIPLGKLALIDPAKKEGWMCYKWMNFWEGETEEEAKEMFPKINSFWNSKLMTYLLNKTWMTYTVSAAIFEDVPVPDYSKVWTDEELYERFELSASEIEFVERGFLVSSFS